MNYEIDFRNSDSFESFSTTAQRWSRRISFELEFAEAFRLALPPGMTEGWGDLIAAARAHLAQLHTGCAIEEFQAAVVAAEREMALIGKAARTYKVHCVGHGHIDMNWMWSWPETVATTHDTFASVLQLMHQFPDFTYSQSQTAVYALIERYFPDMFEQIRERVREGRWEVTAAHWVEGDKNLSSGEALCRHLLHSRRYFSDKFGLAPEDMPVDWEPDTFGHAATIPSFLARAGVKYYYACRTGGGFDSERVGEKRPPLYWWQGPDGSRILVNNEITWYNTYAGEGDNASLPLVRIAGETGLHHWLNVYGVGNHGGGPTRQGIAFYRELQEWPIYPEVVFSTAKRFFESIDAELASLPEGTIPLIAHELNFEFAGCYTSQSTIKQANRLGENYAVEAETLALLGSRVNGLSYPANLLYTAWNNVLFNQFHDILPGSGVRETRSHAEALFQETGAIAGSVKRNVTKSFCEGIDTLSLLPSTPAGDQERERVRSGNIEPSFTAGPGSGAGLTGFSHSSGGGSKFRPITVFNSCAWDRSEMAAVSLYDTGFDPERIVALDDLGIEHPVLIVRKQDWWGHERIELIFRAASVPALGYRTWLLCEGTPKAPAKVNDRCFDPYRSALSRPVVPEAQVRLASGDWFETPYFSFRLDRFQSGLLDVVDRRTGARITAGTQALGAWAYVVERPRGMTAWRLGEEVDSPLNLKSISIDIIGAARNGANDLTDEDPVFAVQITSVLAVPGTSSTVRLTTLVHGLEPRIDFRAEIDWREIGSEGHGIPGLVVRFPLALEDVSPLYEIPFGSVRRDLTGGEEVPALRWAHISGTAKTAGGASMPAGMTLMQDCKYGHSVHGSEMRLRMVRSSFDPDPTPEIARTTVQYSVFLHDSPADPVVLTRLGAAFNHPLLAAPANLHDGPLPASAGFGRVTTPNIILTALKQSASGDGIVLRLVEMNGVDTEAEVVLDPVVAGGLMKAVYVDVIEREQEGATPSWNGGALRAHVPAHGFVTVWLS